MGNAAGGLAYDVSTSSTDYNNNNFWVLAEGVKHGEKEEQKEVVSVFRFIKSLHTERIVLAQRCIQKLRVLKHPCVLSFVESAELEDSLALVTESCVPVENWIKKIKLESISAENKVHLIQEIIWGFRCVILALNFLHSNGGLLHGNLGLHAIFVMPGGDWKVGGMELACNMSSAEDVDYFCRHHNILGKPFISPERFSLRVGDAQNNESVLKIKNPPYYIDIYSLGQCIQRTFEEMDLEIPSSLSKYIALMVHVDIKKRPTALKLSQSAVFNSDYIKLLESINELSLKSPKDALEVLGLLEPKVAELSKSMCAHKILPNVCRTLQIAINDFANRDARESCRQNVQVSVSLLSAMAAIDKLDEIIFRRSCVPILVQLWPMTDRTVRTVLLQSLKSLAALTPSTVVNKTIFDNIVAGFSDSNAKLRESTLMSLMFIVDKLDEVTLQDRLVRCVVNLQNDGEASIRTNATIFLGKIASKLKDNVRAKVLCSCFAKAMKDNFLHCRLAGLKTSTACVKLLDVAQMTSKIIPQASLLLLDKSPEVRSQALLLIEACLDILRTNHANLIVSCNSTDRNDALSPGKQEVNVNPTSSNINQKSATAEHKDAAAWSSWSVLQGISKSLESAAIATTAVSSTPSSQHQTSVAKPTLPVHSVPSNSTLSAVPFDLKQNNSSTHKTDNTRSDVWENEMNNNGMDDSTVSGNGGWEESDTISFDDDDDVSTSHLQVKTNSFGSNGSLASTPIATPTPKSKGMQLPSGGAKVSLTPSSTKSVPAARIKPVVKKLSTSKDDVNWDDF